MIFGLMWIFYPAWLVAVAPETKWSIRGKDKENDKPSSTEEKVILSLVIPAYNEEERIPIMLQSAHDFLQSIKGIVVLDKLNQCLRDSDKRRLSVEWIVVDDGSIDKTCEVVTTVMNSLQSQEYLWKIVSLRKNSGKG